MYNYPSQSFSNTSLKSKQPTLFNQAPSGKSASRHSGGQLWRFEVNHPGLFKSQFGVVDGFLEYHGKHRRFGLLLPDRSYPRGVATGAPAVNNGAGYAKGVSSIAIDGCTASVAGWLLKMDFFTFAGHDKAYACTLDVTTNGSGQAVLNFEPPLKHAVADNELLVVTGVVFTVVSTANHSYSIGSDNLYNVNLNLLEAA